jgi:uncharacterized protein (DUF1778 family)
VTKKLTENKTERMEIRLTKEDKNYLAIASYLVGQTPTKTVRMFIDATINAVKIKVKKGELKIEDFKGIFND